MTDGTAISYAATILKPRQEVYDFWRRWENLPRFSRHLVAVEDLGKGRTKWTAEGPKEPVTWYADTIKDVPGETIHWKSLGNSDIHHEGHVDFVDAPGGRGTEVTVRMMVDVPHGAAGEAYLKMKGADPKQEVAESLRRFKAILECGELPVTEGQPSNRARGDNKPGQESKKVGLR
jgi:uncharacterized membrane protein